MNELFFERSMHTRVAIQQTETFRRKKKQANAPLVDQSRFLSSSMPLSIAYLKPTLFVCIKFSEISELGKTCTC